MDIHLKKFNKLLKGKTIKDVSWLSNDGLQQCGWYKRPIVIEFTDGSYIMPQMDDEGNDGGALFYQDEKVSETIYTTT